MSNWLLRLWRRFDAWGDATPHRAVASTPCFPTVPSFKSPRSPSLELLEHTRRTRDGSAASPR